MTGRRAGLGFAREAAILIGLGVTGAVVSNTVARRERRLAWLGRPPVSSPETKSPFSVPRLRPQGSPVAPPVMHPAGDLGSAVRTPAAPSSASTGSSPAAPAADFSPHPARPWAEVTPEQAKTLFDRGAVFFDARRSAAYREGHVRGARSISVWETDADEKVKAFLEEGHDPNAPIVAYCSGGDCEDSHELAQKLWGVTFDNVYVYRDGFPDWEKHGWPIETGAKK